MIMEEHNKTAEKGKEIEREAGKAYIESDRRERRFLGLPLLWYLQLLRFGCL